MSSPASHIRKLASQYATKVNLMLVIVCVACVVVAVLRLAHEDWYEAGFAALMAIGCATTISRR